MKATLRKNGNMGITINVKQYIFFEDIVEAILSEQGFNKDNSVAKFKPIKTRREVINIIKDYRQSYGSEISYNIDDELRQFNSLAEQNARKLFPDLINPERRVLK